MVLSLDNDNNADERRKSDRPGGLKAAGRKTARAKGKQNPEVGQALRTIYQNTIDENIPSEMLDLLGKLG